MAKDFRMIVELIRPKNLSALNPADFYSDCLLRARVRTIQKDDDGDQVPEGARCSVISKILGRDAGSPPFLRRRARSR